MDRNVNDFNVRLRTIKIRELFIGIIITMILTGITGIVFPSVFESDEIFMLVVLVIALLIFVYALKGTTGIAEDFQMLFEDEIKRDILYVFIINFIFAFLFMLIISSFDIILGLSDPTWISIWEIDSVDIDSDILFFDALTSIIFAPLIEELIFRGILFNRLKIRTGIIPAMIISSFLFAIGHDFGGMCSAFLFGISMCIIYLKTDNILVPMSVHFINNITAVILELTQIDVFLAQFPWIIPSLIVTLIATVLLIKYIFQETGKLKKQYS